MGTLLWGGNAGWILCVFTLRLVSSAESREFGFEFGKPRHCLSIEGRRLSGEGLRLDTSGGFLASGFLSIDAQDLLRSSSLIRREQPGTSGWVVESKQPTVSLEVQAGDQARQTTFHECDRFDNAPRSGESPARGA